LLTENDLATKKDEKNTNLQVNPLHAVVVELVWWNIQRGFQPRHATQQIKSCG